jgi:hypothetical protein
MPSVSIFFFNGFLAYHVRFSESPFWHLFLQVVDESLGSRAKLLRLELNLHKLLFCALVSSSIKW